MKKSTLLIFLMAIGTAVFAQDWITITFDNGASDDSTWNTPENWDTDVVPKIGDLVKIDGFNVVVQKDTEQEEDAICAYLILEGVSSIVVKDNATLTVTFPASGANGTNMQIDPGSTLTIEHGGKLEYDGEIKQEGTLIVNGTVGPVTTAK